MSELEPGPGAEIYSEMEVRAHEECQKIWKVEIGLFPVDNGLQKSLQSQDKIAPSVERDDLSASC